MQQPSSATADSSAVFSSPADGKKAVAVEFKQVSKSFGAHQVIQQVDLSVAVGKWWRSAGRPVRASRRLSA